MIRILFVCTGNICRSPMAEAIARSIVEKYYPLHSKMFEFSSAGIAALVDHPASTEAIHALKTKGINMTGHRGRAIESFVLEDYDLILTMENYQRRYIESLDSDKDAFLLLAYAYAARKFQEGDELPSKELTEVLAKQRLNEISSKLRELEGLRPEYFSSRAFEISDPLGDSLERYLKVAELLEDTIRDIIVAILDESL